MNDPREPKDHIDYLLARWDPIPIRGPKDHLDSLLANDLIKGYTEGQGGTFWVDLYNGRVIDLNEGEVDIFTRGLIYALCHLPPLTDEQRYEVGRHDAALRRI